MGEKGFRVITWVSWLASGAEKEHVFLNLSPSSSLLLLTLHHDDDDYGALPSKSSSSSLRYLVMIDCSEIPACLSACLPAA